LPENWPIDPDPHSSPPLYLVIKGWPHDGGLPTRFRTEPVYILDTNALVLIPDDTFFDMPTLFETLIRNDEKTISFPIREYWLDIGRMSDFERANSEYHGVFK